MEIVEFGWAGQAVDIGQIEDQLRGAWRAEATRSAENGNSLAARTNVLNLIVYAAAREEAEAVATAIERLGERHPSRTIILIADSEATEPAMTSWVHTNVLTLPGTNRRLLFEQVTLAAQGEAARHLPAVVNPLLVSDLPDFLWWVGEPPFQSATFSRMADMVDRLIVDSATFRNSAPGLHELAELAVIPYGAAVSDFAWARLRPWRELVAQFFDPPEHAASLATIEQIEVLYEPAGRLHTSGFSEGLLALGWACSRLGWLVGRRPIEEAPGAFHWQVSTGDRTIEAYLRPRHDERAASGLRRITMQAGGRHPGTFIVDREGAANLATNVNVPGTPSLDQIMRATLPNENDLLLNALSQFGRDRSYDGALVFASQLCRGITWRAQ
jgi:glucose-6-phosphate dehydrogenase assembly protein OpcA